MSPTSCKGFILPPTHLKFWLLSASSSCQDHYSALWKHYQNTSTTTSSQSDIPDSYWGTSVQAAHTVWKHQPSHVNRNITRHHNATQNSTQFHSYEVSISGILHLRFPDHSLLKYLKPEEEEKKKTQIRQAIVYVTQNRQMSAIFSDEVIYLCPSVLLHLFSSCFLSYPLHVKTSSGHTSCYSEGTD